MKELAFVGSSRRDIASFPLQAKRRAGFELRKLQAGLEPADSKSFPVIGPGVQELRIWITGGTFRVMYLARIKQTVYVLHAFEKKTQATAKIEINLARERYKEVLQRVRNSDD